MRLQRPPMKPRRHGRRPLVQRCDEAFTKFDWHEVGPHRRRVLYCTATIIPFDHALPTLRFYKIAARMAQHR